ncbi:MAG: DoxX family protein [Acidobacteriaceae bacterium]
MSPTQELDDRRIAYALLRVFLGVNIAIHGVSRLSAGPAVFQGKIDAQFAHAPLPHAAVAAFALLLPWAETIVGLFVLLGAATRLALIGGALLMIVLTFGSGLVQDWPVAGIQLTYAIAYALLLFLRSYNGWSIDAWRQSRSAHRS